MEFHARYADTLLVSHSSSLPERSPPLGHVWTAAVGGPALPRVVDAPRALPEYKVAEAVVALAVLCEMVGQSAS